MTWRQDNMCRLFGFRSVILSQVHSSLVSAENALHSQSNLHPDGWGVCYYISGAPHIIKSKSSALDDHIFKKVSGVVSSQTVLAHLRKATLGKKDILNTHPFQYGKWVFAHNGNIKSFNKHRDQLKNRVKPELRRFILGETDSELVFYLILSKISDYFELDAYNIDYNRLVIAVKEAVKDITDIVGDYSKIDNAGETETYLSFILTNGKTMLAHHGGKNLYYSTHKNRCPDRDVCASFAAECEAPSTSGYINHLLFSSEPLSGENIWIPLKLGQIIGANCFMKIQFD